MNYIESSNVISMNNALPTTDATGKKKIKYWRILLISQLNHQSKVILISTMR